MYSVNLRAAYLGMSQKWDKGRSECIHFFLARSCVIVWSPNIFTYVDDGLRGASDMIGRQWPSDMPDRTEKRIVQE